MKRLGILLALILSVALAIPMGVAMAAEPDGTGPWADSVVSNNQGTQKGGGSVPVERSDPTDALGPAEDTNALGTFYSLGIGGDIVLGFDNWIIDGSGVAIESHEVTGGTYPPEPVQVYFSQDNSTWVYADTINEDDTVELFGLPWARYVKLIDVTDPDDHIWNADGYDVDGVKALNTVESFSIVAEPPTALNPVGAQHTITATITPMVEGIPVNFNVSGANTASGTILTNASGVAVFPYTGSNAGLDTITVWIDQDLDTNFNATIDSYDVVYKTWFRLIWLRPPFDINPINSTHTVTAGIWPPVRNVEVCFEVTLANTYGDCDLTNRFGVAEFTYTGTLPGTDFIRAYIDEDGSGHYDSGEHTLPYQAVKVWLVEYVTGGGYISNGKGKNVAEKISFGGNVGYDDTLTLHGQWNIEFHDVTGGTLGDALDKGHFHSTSIDSLTFQRLGFPCPSPDPPTAYFNWANFIATGRVKLAGESWQGGWTVDVRVADFGEGKLSTDSIRILLYDPTPTLVYDSWDWNLGDPPPNPAEAGDFADEDTCGFPYSFRHRLDGGNLQIHHGTK